jgi:hypothetical protein
MAQVESGQVAPVPEPVQVSLLEARALLLVERQQAVPRYSPSLLHPHSAWLEPSEA